MKLVERLRQWWKPAEYDNAEGRPVSDGEGHPLTAEERDEDRPPDFHIRYP